MVDSTVADYLTDLERKVAHLEGELSATLAHLASLEANDEHHRIELERARAELAASEAGAEHAVRHAKEQRESDRHRIESLEARLVEAEESRRTAERERSAVIAALGRKARNQLHKEG